MTLPQGTRSKFLAIQARAAERAKALALEKLQAAGLSARAMAAELNQQRWRRLRAAAGTRRPSSEFWNASETVIACYREHVAANPKRS
ncbi:hypothetical protein [Methylorubrum extorquens]|uniref:Uncharacterized protein n=1 Tax=Methylorubrum extorquens TaxID=408 RepID=A0AAX3WAV0_METEX|nr:hypothetical protein [Methylorubrum extorquens]WHQ68562.1 hypothetical protein KEC54_19570 [Methylorubrum extorquens]